MHTTGFAPTQVPDWQVSLCVQESPSLHEEPVALVGFAQIPVAGAHVPARWHWSDARHTTGFAPTHAPAWQLSLCVQASPSLHEAPAALVGFEQTPVAGAQVPAT